jgi:hypothetical protein
MDPVRALGRSGLLGGLAKHREGGAGKEDAVDDQWTAKRFKEERRWLIQELQALAAEKNVRVTILG